MPYLLPAGTRIVPLQKGSKMPFRGTHGHLKSTAMEDFDFDLVPKYANYGIVLDDMFVVLDIDDMDRFLAWTYENGYEIQPTWKQQTRRGYHYLYKRDWKYGTNVKVPGADIKCNGYIVGPGSKIGEFTYTFLGGSLL
jgi:hypothetical protein